jgi:hypothetical protein
MLGLQHVLDMRELAAFVPQDELLDHVQVAAPDRPDAALPGRERLTRQADVSIRRPSGL